MRYFFTALVFVVVLFSSSAGVKAADVPDVPDVPLSIPFEKFSLGMREAAVKNLGAEADSDGDLVASVSTGDQHWMIVLSMDKGRVTQYSLAARSDAPHFSAALEAISGQGYVPAKISVADKDVELLALGAEPDTDVKRRAVFDEFVAQAEKSNGPAAVVFMRAADFTKALKMPLPEVTAKLASAPVYLLRHNADGMTVIVCTTLAAMAEPASEPAVEEAADAKTGK